MLGGPAATAATPRCQPWGHGCGRELCWVSRDCCLQQPLRSPWPWFSRGSGCVGTPLSLPRQWGARGSGAPAPWGSVSPFWGCWFLWSQVALCLPGAAGLDRAVTRGRSPCHWVLAPPGVREGDLPGPAARGAIGLGSAWGQAPWCRERCVPWPFAGVLSVPQSRPGWPQSPLEAPPCCQPWVVDVLVCSGSCVCVCRRCLSRRVSVAPVRCQPAEPGGCHASDTCSLYRACPRPCPPGPFPTGPNPTQGGKAK